MASAFETEGAFLTQEQADHINERHVFRKEHVKTSLFSSHLNLVYPTWMIDDLTPHI